MGLKGSSQRREHSDCVNLLWKGILGVGTANRRVLKQEHIRYAGEEERRPVYLERDKNQGGTVVENEVGKWDQIMRGLVGHL